MCGIVGFVDTESPDSQENLSEIVLQMALAIAHRGPDDAGHWISREGVSLGHRRLSILDLSPTGHQPMLSHSSRYVMIFNGEIYNFKNIKKELDAHSTYHWRGHSDTEILIEAIATWGIHEALKKTAGMFAFALYDREEQILTLGRDRIGEKPLYYGWLDQTFVFASELKALKKHPKWKGLIDTNAQTLFFKYNYIPAPHSIYQNINKLEPGKILSLNLKNKSVETSTYWSLKEVINTTQIISYSETDALSQLDTHLKCIVSQQIIADVPVGAFLSGGVDSSLIVSIMQSVSARPIKTFTIGFQEQDFNEAIFAKQVAQHLGTDHTEAYISSQEAMDVIPKLPHIYDEPFADVSQIPTYLVAKLAKSQVTVSLSGDAGDELFGGYNRYIWANRVWELIRYLPPSLRSMATKLVQTVSPETYDSLYKKLAQLIPAAYQFASPGEKIHKFSRLFSADSQRNLYDRLVSFWENPESLIYNAKKSPYCIESPQDRPFVDQMMYSDTLTYLPDDILVKVDRAAMAVHLEGRVPFLDAELIAFAWSLPSTYKINSGQSKVILKKLLNQYVPASLIERPKMGFGVPIDKWLRGPLKEWAEQLLDKKALENAGLNSSLILKKWHEHSAGTHNWQNHLWSVLMYQAWLQENV